MAASAVDIGMKGIVAATASGVGSFAHKMGAYYKRQGIGGGLAAEIAGIAGAALPGGAVAGTLANAALKVARVTTAVVSKVGSVTQKVVDHVKGPPKF